jgi:integrase
MASISTDKAGNRRILFSGPNRTRLTVYVGAVPMKTARTIKVHVENLAAALLAGHPPEPETSEWLGGRDDVLYGKLAAVGLVPAREPAIAEKRTVALGEFLDQYLSGRTDIKPSTRCNLEQVRRNLVDHFGADRLLVNITPGDADEFRVALFNKLGANTVRRNCGRAKQFFRAAVRKRLIQENPFADMKGCAVKATTDRFYFVTRETADKVLAACPDAQWRLLFALSRYGGLRCPSEHLALRWGDVDWEHDRITIHSPKTERHEGKESRQIPLFPELRPYLNEVWDKAVSGYRNKPLSTAEAIITPAPLRRQENSVFCRCNRLNRATSEEFEKCADYWIFAAAKAQQTQPLKRPNNLLSLHGDKDFVDHFAHAGQASHCFLSELLMKEAR